MIKLFSNKFGLKLIAFAFASFALNVPAQAHHSFAMYDNSKVLTIEGVVREFRWANPHGAIVLTMIQGGKSVDYVVELSGLNVMYRQGWNRKSVQVGDRLKVTVHPRRDSTSNGSFAGAVKADGTILRGTAPQ